MSCPTYSAVCIDVAPFALSGATPEGGTYSGAGVSGGVFTPSVAGAGTHTITYTYTNPSTGCTNTCSFDIVVAPIPTTSTITGLASVSGGQAGVVYSVSNTVGSTYQWTVPTNAIITSGQGTNSITVTFGLVSGNVTVTETNQYGCVGSPQLLAVTVIAGPPTAASNITFSNDQGTSIDVCWTNGNGSNRMLVVSTSDPSLWSWSPVNGITYAANSNYAAATDVDPYTPVVKVVYNGNGSCATVTGITANTVYYFRVYEYVYGLGGAPTYQTAVATGNPNQPKKLAFDNITTKTSNVNFNDLTIRVRNRANNPYTVPSAIELTVTKNGALDGSLVNNVATVNGTSFILMSTFRWVNADGVEAASLSVTANDGSYLTGTSNTFILRPERPTTQASNVIVSAPTSGDPCYARNISWTPGSGSKVIIIGRRGNTPASPTDYTNYTDNQWFGLGTQVGAGTPPSYVVYKGESSGANNINVYNLENNKLYFFRAVAYNGTNTNVVYAVTGGILNPNSGTTANCGTRIDAVGNYIELANYEARSRENKAKLNWKTDFEQNITGFEIYRADRESNDAEFVKVGSFNDNDGLIALGNTTSGKDYYFTDSDHSLQVGHTYMYMLTAIGYDGERIELGVRDLTINTQNDDNTTLVLSPVNPSPVTNDINFTIEISQSTNVTVEILDMSGRKIAVPIYAAKYDSGVHTISIPFNEGVSSGMYLLNVIAGTESATEKFIYVK
jgi:hypothetical protein